MNVVQIVFSPTGGTQRVADVIADEWGGTGSKIDLTDAKFDFSSAALVKSDIALVAVPSFGGRVPALAAQRLSAVHGNGTRCVIVCVYGNRAYEDTLIELSDLAKQSGFQVIAAVSAVAEHSILRQYAAGRPDRQDQDELRGIAEKILVRINAENAAAPQIPGDRPYKKAGGVGLIPRAGKGCTGCGLCAKQCPAEAISRGNIKTADGKKCIACMRCVSQCPQSARKVNGVLVSVAAMAIKRACAQRKEIELYI